MSSFIIPEIKCVSIILIIVLHRRIQIISLKIIAIRPDKDATWKHSLCTNIWSAMFVTRICGNCAVRLNWTHQDRLRRQVAVQRPATCHLRGNVDKNHAAYVTSCAPATLRTTSRPPYLLSLQRSTTFYCATFARSSIRVIRLISFWNCADVRLFYF